jgi:hypothetical protein
MKTTATMMYGHVETFAERVEHLRRLREQQDRSLARNNGGGYTAFICWSLQPDNTEMAGTPKTGGYEYLKTLAISRMYLDNFPNMQSSWVTQGDKVGQMALLYGANDMGHPFTSITHFSLTGFPVGSKPSPDRVKTLPAASTSPVDVNTWGIMLSIQQATYFFVYRL